MSKKIKKTRTPKLDESGNPIPRKPRVPKLDENGNPIPRKPRTVNPLRVIIGDLSSLGARKELLVKKINKYTEKVNEYTAELNEISAKLKDAKSRFIEETQVMKASE